jgi:hypothetical protein
VRIRGVVKRKKRKKRRGDSLVGFYLLGLGGALSTATELQPHHDPSPLSASSDREHRQFAPLELKRKLLIMVRC